MADAPEPAAGDALPPPPNFLQLPAELIDHILTYLSPLELVCISSTCRMLHSHSHKDTLWQPHVARNLPRALPSPAPYPTFRALYTAHHPFWFLPRHRLWFADTPLTGKLLLARYNPNGGDGGGCIEAHALAAERGGAHTFQFWEHDRDVIIHTFHPCVVLDATAPAVRLDAAAYRRAKELQRRAGASAAAAATHDDGVEDDNGLGTTQRREGSKLAGEVPMSTFASTRVTGSGASLYSQFMLARPCPDALISRGTAVWPPLVIPSPDSDDGNDGDGGDGGGGRTRNESVQLYKGANHRPERWADVSQTTWRLRRWMEFSSRALRNAVGVMARNDNGEMVAAPAEGTTTPFGSSVNARVNVGLGLHPQASVAPNGSISLRVGEDVTTFATLDRACYTPTKTKPYRGIWVGDYSGHGCEFLVVLQPDEEEVRAGKRPLPTGAAQLLDEMEARDRRLRPLAATAALGELAEGSIGSYEQQQQLLAQDLVAHITANQEMQAADDVLQNDSAYHMGFLTPHSVDDNNGDDDDDDDDEDILPTPQHDDTTVRLTDENEMLSSAADEYAGRIEAIKLTGDPNIPRGEYTFIAPDIGPAGLVRIADEEIFRGARIVRSVGHIAARGFQADGYTPSQLILVSHDTLAQYWEAFGHISFYKRVDIEQFLTTD